MSNFARYAQSCSFQPNNMNQKSNSDFNYGYSGNLGNDKNYINSRLEESNSIMQSVLDPNRVKNCNSCMPIRSNIGHNGIYSNLPIAPGSNTPAMSVADIDSIMSNRNSKLNGNKKGRVNNINVLKFKTYDNNQCGKGLDQISSILTFPKQFYRETAINRFYDLNINPQQNIYYNDSINTQLEAKDNFVPQLPFSLNNDYSLPSPIEGFNNKKYNNKCSIPVFDSKTYPNINRKINPNYETDSDSGSEQ